MPWIDQPGEERPTNIRCIDCKWLASMPTRVFCESPCPWSAGQPLAFATPQALFKRHECDLYQPKEGGHE